MLYLLSLLYPVYEKIDFFTEKNYFNTVICVETTKKYKILSELRFVKTLIVICVIHKN